MSDERGKMRPNEQLHRLIDILDTIQEYKVAEPTRDADCPDRTFLFSDELAELYVSTAEANIREAISALTREETRPKSDFGIVEDIPF